MSLEALNYVLRLDIKPSSLKFVLTVMANYANEDLETYPSVDTLARVTSLNRKTIYQSIKRLVEGGYLDDTGIFRGRTGRVKMYKIVIHGSTFDPLSGAVNRPNTGSVELTQKRNSSKNGIVPKTDSNRPKNGTETDPKTGHRYITDTGRYVGDGADASSSPPPGGFPEQVPMTADWKPEIPEDALQLIRARGVTEEIQEQERIAFVGHHLAPPPESRQRRTRSNWTTAFVHTLHKAAARLKSDGANQRESEQGPAGSGSWADKPHPFPEYFDDESGAGCAEGAG